MKPSWTTILVPLFGVWICVLGQDCRPQKLEECYGFLDTKFKTGSFVTAQTREDLRNFCWELNNMLTCINNYKVDCIQSLEGQRVITKLFSGIRTFIDDLCRANSPTAEEYLRHAPCLNQAEPKVKNCTEKVMNSYETGRQFPDEQSQLDALKTFCCDMRPAIGCVLEGYQRECGADSVQSARMSIELVIQPMEETVCSAVDKSYCSSAIGMPHHSAALVALVSSVAMVWLWWRHH